MQGDFVAFCRSAILSAPLRRRQALRNSGNPMGTVITARFKPRKEKHPAPNHSPRLEGQGLSLRESRVPGDLSRVAAFVADPPSLGNCHPAQGGMPRQCFDVCFRGAASQRSTAASWGAKLTSSCWTACVDRPGKFGCINQSAVVAGRPGASKLIDTIPCAEKRPMQGAAGSSFRELPRCASASRPQSVDLKR